MIADVRRKAFRTAEKLLDPCPLKCGQTFHCIVQYGFEVIEVSRDLIETKIFGNTPHPPGFRIRLKGTQQQFPRIVFVVSAGVVVAQYRQIRTESVHRVKQNVVVFTGMEWQIHAH